MRKSKGMTTVSFPVAKDIYLCKATKCQRTSPWIHKGEKHVKLGRRANSPRFHNQCFRAKQLAGKAEFDRKMGVIKEMQNDLKFNPQPVKIAYDATHKTRADVLPTLSDALKQTVVPEPENPFAGLLGDDGYVFAEQEYPTFTREWRQPVQEIRNSRQVEPWSPEYMKRLSFWAWVIVLTLMAGISFLGYEYIRSVL